MKWIGKCFLILPRLLLPDAVYEKIEGKLKSIGHEFSKSFELRLFFKIIFFPILVVVALAIAIVKAILIICMPSDIYTGFMFSCKAFLEDIVSKKMGLSLACKRQKLRKELFLKGREERKTFGEKNPDVTFYVIRPYYFVAPNELLTHPQHLLFYYYLILQKISHAVQNGWLPVVDLENYEGLLYFAEKEPVHGTRNAWEYFWKQPSPYTLEEVYQSKNVILSTRNSVDYGHIPPTLMERPFQKYAEKLSVQCSKYAVLTEFNDFTRDYIDQWQEKLFPKDKRILGVVYRSTSYGKDRTPNSSHPMQPSLASLVVKARKLMKEYEMDYVFFVNEEEENIRAMTQSFGEKLIVLPRARYENFHEFSPEDPNPLYVFGQRYPTNLSYLTEIALLSRCTGLLGAMSSGTRAALIWNHDQYEVKQIVDLGLW